MVSSFNILLSILFNASNTSGLWIKVELRNTLTFALGKYLSRSAKVSSIIPVSYTHLDVYKRQVLLSTFFLTVIFDLTGAIEVGLLIACVLFMKRVMETTEDVYKRQVQPRRSTDHHFPQ